MINYINYDIEDIPSPEPCHVVRDPFNPHHIISTTKDTVFVWNGKTAVLVPVDQCEKYTPSADTEAGDG